MTVLASVGLFSKCLPHPELSEAEVRCLELQSRNLEYLIPVASQDAYRRNLDGKQRNPGWNSALLSIDIAVAPALVSFQIQDNGSPWDSLSLHF